MGEMEQGLKDLENKNHEGGGGGGKRKLESPLEKLQGKGIKQVSENWGYNEKEKIPCAVSPGPPREQNSGNRGRGDQCIKR